jgi:hypothetical protein
VGTAGLKSRGQAQQKPIRNCRSKAELVGVDAGRKCPLGEGLSPLTTINATSAIKAYAVSLGR